MWKMDPLICQFLSYLQILWEFFIQVPLLFVMQEAEENTKKNCPRIKEKSAPEEKGHCNSKTLCFYFYFFLFFE